MTTRANLYIDQGTDFAVSLDVVDFDGEIVNLTGVSFESDAKKVYSESVVFTFGIVVTDAAEGKMEMSISAENTSVIPPGKYKYDLIITLATTKKLKLLEGIAFVIDTVTEYSA